MSRMDFLQQLKAQADTQDNWNKFSLGKISARNPRLYLERIHIFPTKVSSYDLRFQARNQLYDYSSVDVLGWYNEFCAKVD